MHPGNVSEQTLHDELRRAGEEMHHAGDDERGCVARVNERAKNLLRVPDHAQQREVRGTGKEGQDESDDPHGGLLLSMGLHHLSVCRCGGSGQRFTRPWNKYFRRPMNLFLCPHDSVSSSGRGPKPLWQPAHDSWS